MKESDLLSVEEVAVLVDCSIQSINMWYLYKRNFPDSELASLLPDYIQSGPRHKRVWKSEDVPMLIKFKQSIVRGRNGVMGDVTQRRIKNGKSKINNKD